MFSPTGLPVISTDTGCYYSGIFSISAFFWLPALVYEPVLCLMVVWKAREGGWLERLWQRHKTTDFDRDFNSGRLVKAFARDRYAPSAVTPEPNIADSCPPV